MNVIGAADRAHGLEQFLTPEVLTSALVGFVVAFVIGLALSR